MSVSVSVIIEAEFSGVDVAWTDISQDVRLAYGIDMQRGITGGGVTDRVASPGTLRFTLDNSAANSARRLGYYSPGSIHVRSGFDVGIRVRLRTVHRGVSRVHFVGTLDEIVPAHGTLRDRTVQCLAVDWLDEASLWQISGLATQLDTRSDTVLAAIIAAMPKQPVAIDIDAGTDVYEYALDNARDESSTALSEFQRVEISEQGLLYIKGDGTLRGENRHARALNAATNRETFDGSMTDLSASRGRSDVANRVRAIVHPRRVDLTPTTLLFALQSKPLLAVAATQTITGSYVDPLTRASRVGGVDMQATAAVTDYTANSLEDGTGTDLTAFITVSTVFGGNAATFTVRNTGTTDAYLTKLQARGRGLFDYEPVAVEATDQVSIQRFGERVLTLDMYYQSATPVPQSAANWLLQTYRNPRMIAKSLEVIGNASDDRMRQALSLEISDRIGIRERVTGVTDSGRLENQSDNQETWLLGTAGLSELGTNTFLGLRTVRREPFGNVATGFYINSISMRVAAGNIITTRYGLAPSFAFAYWILGQSGSSELGATTRLGYA